MIFELLVHVPLVVSTRNRVPCRISDAKEGRTIFAMAELEQEPSGFH